MGVTQGQWEWSSRQRADWAKLRGSWGGAQGAMSTEPLSLPVLGKEGKTWAGDIPCPRRGHFQEEAREAAVLEVKVQASWTV